MSLTTHSRFYYGHTITSDNQYIDFKEGVGSELTATLRVGTYSLTEFIAEVKRAMDVAGALTYTVSVDRATRLVTISTTSTFSLLVTSGSHADSAPWSLLGFSGADKTGAITYTGSAGSGSEYVTQFILQDHISSDNWYQAADATVTKAANGRVQVAQFGIEQFVQMNFKFITDKIHQSNMVIRNNATGVADLQAFMQYLVSKGPVEYMADEDDRATYQTLMLESSPDSQNGTGYKLKEMYDRGAPGYFETGILKMRVI